VKQPRVLLVWPRVQTSDPTAKRLKVELQDLSFARGYRVENFVWSETQSVAESSRKIPLVEAWQAHSLYNMLHEGPCAVWLFGDPRVTRNVMSGPSTKNSMSLAHLLRYKAYVASVSRTASTAQFEAEMTSFETWIREINCTGHRDPRALPLNTFDSDFEWLDLDEEAGQEYFEHHHGTATARMDSRRRHWAVPSAAHGGQAMYISGTTLPSGFHWDVQAAPSPSRLFNLTQTWSMPRDSYLNVGPNGHVRSGQSSSKNSAKIICKAPNPNAPEEPKNRSKGRRGRASLEPGRRRRR